MSIAARLDPQSEPARITVDWDLAFQDPATKKGLAYWRNVRGARTMPSRQDLSPRAMRDFLTHVNLVDVLPGTGETFEYGFSLQGGHSREIFGHLAGHKLRDIFSPTIEERWRKSFELARVAATPVRLLTRAGTVSRSSLVCEALLAPLGDGKRRIDALFWVFASWSDK